MNFNKSLLFGTILLCLLTTNLSAQKSPIKFGKINIDKLRATHYSSDSSVSAVVIADVGETSFVMDKSTQDWKVVFRRHTRVKIYKKDGYDMANVEIPYYDPGTGTEEKISQLKAVSYNLEAGKVVKTKLGKSELFDEKTNKYWHNKKFAIPNVKEGTIIEYSYTLTSDFIRNLREWEFQNIVPVQYSQYKVVIPEFFRYQFLSQGYEVFETNTSSKEEEFLYEWRSQPDQTNGLGKSGTSTLHSFSKVNAFVAENVPAFKVESHIDTYKNYITKISFELVSIQYPNQPVNKMMGTWETLNKKFLESSSFGKAVAQSGFLKKVVNGIVAGISTDEEKIGAILSYVKKNVSWNGFNGKYLNSNFKKVLDEGKGSAPEINLLLTSMLQKAGIDADPVLISTRSNGWVRKHYAISDQFNYVICRANWDGKYILLDATEHYLPVGTLPNRCLNKEGWAVSATNSGWVSLSPNTKTSKQISGALTLQEDGVLSGDLKMSYAGYNARSPRYQYHHDGEEEFISKRISESGWEIDEMKVEGASELSKPFVEKYKLSSEEGVEGLGHIIYLDMLLAGKKESNPFKMEERKYPVIFDTPFEEMYYVTVDVPEGYILEEVPAPVAFSLPNKGGKFFLQVSFMNNKITVMSKLMISKSMFGQGEYLALKEFYKLVLEKQNQQLVLKKS